MTATFNLNPADRRIHRTDAQRINDAADYALRGATRIRAASDSLLRALEAYPWFDSVEPVDGHEIVDLVGWVREVRDGCDPQRVAARVEALMGERVREGA